MICVQAPGCPCRPCRRHSERNVFFSKKLITEAREKAEAERRGVTVEELRGLRVAEEFIRRRRLGEVLFPGFPGGMGRIG